MVDRVSVFQDWLFDLTMQQQSVLVLACRGPDGVAKFHPSKEIVVRYRATVLKAAYLGRSMWVDEGDDTTFMSLLDFSKPTMWDSYCKMYFNYVDELPHHYHLHLMHGAQIIGYKHPHALFRQRWRSFYERACTDLHLTPETADEMDNRLSDWHRRHWNNQGKVTDAVS